MSDVTASPIPFSVTEDGKEVEYTASPLNDADIVELDHWLQEQFIARVRGSLPEDVSDDDYDRAMRLAYKEAAHLTFMSGQGATLMASVDGISRVLWHQLKKRSPKLTHEQVRKMCTNPVTAKKAAEAFQKLDMKPAEDAANKQEAANAAAKKRRDRLHKLKKDKDKAKRRARRKNKSTNN